MKKTIGLILMVVMFVLAIGYANGEESMIVKGVYPSTVQEWIVEWANETGNQKYIELRNTVVEGYYYGYGVVINRRFKEDFGVDFMEEKCREVLADIYDGLEMEMTVVGYHEGYPVCLLKVKANEPIGCVYNDGKEIYYYEGEMLFMVCEEEF